MPSSNDPRGDLAEQPAPLPPRSETPGSEGRAARATRRAVLALGGLLAGGRSVLAAPDDAGVASPTAQARLKLAQSALEAVRANIGRGLFGPGERDPIGVWSRRRMEARIALSETKAARIAAAQEHLDEMKGLEQVVNRLRAGGEVDQLTWLDAEYRRLEAEAWLEQEKGKK